MSNASGTSQDRNPVEALADEFLERQRGGERPTLEEYCRRHPELADDIRDLFPVLIRMEDFRSDGPDDSTGGVAAVHTATRLERLGDYRILREVGRGGMGVVYEAEQESLGRRVALKVLPDAALSDAQQVLRFQREARAAARLHHTNIVPVFGVGRDDGHHYYVMQFIPGMGWTPSWRSCGGCGGAPGRPAGSRRGGRRRRGGGRGDPHRAVLVRRIRNGEPGADGRRRRSPPSATPHHGAATPASPTSHLRPSACGRLGRLAGPVRPRPHLLPQCGPHRAPGRRGAGIRQPPGHPPPRRQALEPPARPQGNVWVADFGLAKSADAEDLTHTGDIVGTVRYMAPERFAGKCDVRSDVYALGLTLYELLALRPAFAASDRHELMRRVMSEEPERLRGLVPHLPRDLETIVTKAIDREPAGGMRRPRPWPRTCSGSSTTSRSRRGGSPRRSRRGGGRGGTRRWRRWRRAAAWRWWPAWSA